MQSIPSKKEKEGVAWTTGSTIDNIFFLLSGKSTRKESMSETFRKQAVLPLVLERDAIGSLFPTPFLRIQLNSLKTIQQTMVKEI